MSPPAAGTPARPMDLHFRAAQPADYETLTTWIVDREACLRWAGPRVPFPFTAQGLPALLQMPGATTCILVQAAEAEGRMLGFGQFWPGPGGTVHLGRLLVDPERRGAGVGRRLCQALMQRAVQDTGAQAITLRVFRDNPVAVALYEQLGFAPVDAESTDSVLFMRAARSRAGW